MTDDHALSEELASTQNDLLVAVAEVRRLREGIDALARYYDTVWRYERVAAALRTLLNNEPEADQ